MKGGFQKGGGKNMKRSVITTALILGFITPLIFNLAQATNHGFRSAFQRAAQSPTVTALTVKGMVIAKHTKITKLAAVCNKKGCYRFAGYHDLNMADINRDRVLSSREMREGQIVLLKLGNRGVTIINPATSAVRVKDIDIARRKVYTNFGTFNIETKQISRNLLGNRSM